LKQNQVQNRQVQNNTGTLNPTSSNSVLDQVSKYCISQGNKLLLQTDASGTEVKMCVSPDGKKCNALEYFNKKCSF
jgi:putative hemolysin